MEKEIGTTAARGGKTLGHMRYVLAISFVAAAVALVVCWVLLMPR